jgi:WD40 repeat protein
MISTGTSDGSVLVHDLREGTSSSLSNGSSSSRRRRSGSITTILSHNGHQGSVHELAFLLSNPSHLLSVAHDGVLLLWDLNRESQRFSSTTATSTSPTALSQILVSPVPLLAFDYHISLNTLLCTGENDALMFAFNIFS